MLLAGFPDEGAARCVLRLAKSQERDESFVDAPSLLGSDAADQAAQPSGRRYLPVRLRAD